MPLLQPPTLGLPFTPPASALESEGQGGGSSQQTCGCLCSQPARGAAGTAERLAAGSRMPGPGQLVQTWLSVEEER